MEVSFSIMTLPSMIKGCGWQVEPPGSMNDREPKDLKSNCLLAAVASKSIEGLSYYQSLNLYFAMMAKHGYRHGDQPQLNRPITL